MGHGGHERTRCARQDRDVSATRRGLLSLSMAALLAAPLGCVGSAEQKPLEVETGRRAETTHDGLVRMRGSALEGVWVKPGADVRPFQRLLIGDIRMAYKRPPRSGRSSTGNNFPLTRSQAERLERLLRETLTEQIEESESWSMAEEPGPDVLLIEPSLMDLVVSVPPSQQPTQTTFTTSTGAVTLVLELRDSETHEILARAADRSEARAPGTSSQQLFWSNPVSNTSAVRSIFRRWARIFVARLDTAHRLASESAAGEVGPDVEQPSQDEAAGEDGGEGQSAEAIPRATSPT